MNWSALAAVAFMAVAIGACFWMIHVSYRGGRSQTAPPAPKPLPGAELAEQLSERLRARLSRLRDPALQLAVGSRLEAAQRLPPSERKLVVLELSIDLDRLSPEVAIASHLDPAVHSTAVSAGDAPGLATAAAIEAPGVHVVRAGADSSGAPERAPLAALPPAEPAGPLPLEVLAAPPEMRDALVARAVLAALPARLTEVGGPKLAEKLLHGAGKLPGDLPGLRAMLDNGGLRAWTTRLVELSRDNLGPERTEALLELAAHEVGKSVPLACFPALLESFPDGCLAGEKSYAAAREALWEDFLQTRRELHDAQDQLLHTQAVAALAELSATIAHEINNPLASVTGLLQLLRARLADPQHQRLLGLAEQEAKRIAKLVGQLTHAVERASGPAEPVEVAPLVDASLALVERTLSQNQIAVEKRIATSRPALGDPQELRQALLHLLLNAAGRMKRGGTLTVEVSDAPNGVSFAVRDTGGAPSPEGLARLFEPEHLTQVIDPLGGRGSDGGWLGLKAAQRIAAAQGGELVAGIAPAGGLAMTLRLRAASRIQEAA